MTTHTHYTSSTGQKVLIESMHPSHCLAAANKIERENGDMTLAQALRESGERRAAEWEAAHPEYVRKADRK